tara:strand:+ start:599 stop:883 length:285 start_codon:yes stop_codon:yes gene_type:complete
MKRPGKLFGNAAKIYNPIVITKEEVIAMKQSIKDLESELEATRDLLTRLRNSIDMFKGHGMPGFRDRAEAYVLLAIVDDFLPANSQDQPSAGSD